MSKPFFIFVSPAYSYLLIALKSLLADSWRFMGQCTCRNTEVMTSWHVFHGPLHCSLLKDFYGKLDPLFLAGDSLLIFHAKMYQEQPKCSSTIIWWPIFHALPASVNLFWERIFGARPSRHMALCNVSNPCACWDNASGQHCINVDNSCKLMRRFLYVMWPLGSTNGCR